jgi:catechol-2,3-dioxygenase
LWLSAETPCNDRVKPGFRMSVQVYGCNHVAIEVDDLEKAAAFYQDVFNLKKLAGK